MNYRKLMLAVTGGILLAVGIIVGLDAAARWYRERQLRTRLAEFQELSRRVDCAHIGACGPEKYTEHLKLVKNELATLPQAARGYCEAMVSAPNKERQQQLRNECEAETAARMTRDLE